MICVCRYDWCQPIVLIGHSFGGLALKSLVVELERESNIRNPTDSLTESSVQHAKMFLRNLRGVAFYAVPHIGSSNLSEYVKKLSERNLKCSPGIAGNIQPWQRDMVQLSVDFDRIATGNNIVIYAFCEGRAMGQLVRICQLQWILQSTTRSDLMLFSPDMCNFCSMIGLGNFGGF
jgi:hypothetical protein